MNPIFRQFLLKCENSNKPIKKVTLLVDEENNNSKTFCVIADWISEIKPSDSIDFIIDTLLSTIDKEVFLQISYVYVFDSLENCLEKKYTGFRRIGVYH